MKQLIGLTSCIALWMTVQSLAATPAPLFSDDAILDVELRAPLTTAYRQKNNEERSWSVGELVFSNTDNTEVTLEVGIRTRGIFRRKNCRLPPLQLDLRKKQAADTLFAGQNKLKLVSPCQNNKTSQQHLILEYLAYRTLNILTPDSLRVRMLRLRYVDTDGKRKPWTHLAFLIEPEKGLASRRGLKVHHVPRLQASQLDSEKTAIVEFFQLLIANNDFSTIRGPAGRDCCHNVEIIGPPEGSDGLIPVPYDFDASGLVNTGYAAPPKKLKIKTVRTRYFRGRCRAPETWENTAAWFRSKRGEIIGLFTDTVELSSSMKRKTVRYIEEFYAILDKPKRMQREIKDRCHGSS